MLVSKIKPCKSKYKSFLLMKLRTAHYISYSLFDGTGIYPNYMDNCSNLELIHAKQSDFLERLALIRYQTNTFGFIR